MPESAPKKPAKKQVASAQGEDLFDAGVGLAAFADGGEELAVLQLDAVHGDIDLADVNLLVLVRTEIVVAGSPLVNGATKQGEFALVPSAQAQNFIKNLIAHLRCETLSAGIVKSYGLAQTVLFRGADITLVWRRPLLAMPAIDSV